MMAVIADFKGGGTTGLPKALVHGHGGILLEQLKHVAFNFDMRPEERLFFFTTTGWMIVATDGFSPRCSTGSTPFGSLRSSTWMASPIFMAPMSTSMNSGRSSGKLPGVDVAAQRVPQFGGRLARGVIGGGQALTHGVALLLHQVGQALLQLVVHMVAFD